MNTTETLESLTEKAIHRRIPVICFVAILMTIGIIGNSHVLFIFRNIPSKHSTYPLFVKILACVDLATCLIHMPLEITDLMIAYTYVTENGCKIMRFNQMTLLNVSLFVLVLISYERYNRLCRPLQAQMTPFSAKCLTFCVIVLAVLISSPMYVVNGHHVIKLGHNVTGVMCFVSDDYVGSTFLFISYVIILLSFTISVVLIISRYMLIIFTFKKQKKQSKNTEPPDKQNQQTRVPISRKPKPIFYIKLSGGHDRAYAATLRTTKTLVLVTILFISVFTPFVVLSAFIISHPDFKEHMPHDVLIFYHISMRMIFINNVANPFIYGFTDNRFKRKLTSLYKLCAPKDQRKGGLR